ncbi:MAG: NFACT family protein, partial [Oscillospiraceae bacterium]
MALDTVMLSALVSELRPKLEGARIDKVQQPEREQILLSVRNNGENLRLLINAGAGSGRIALTQQSFENPAEPPMFCMLLRKYLVGARIEKLTQPNWERLLLVDIISHNELGDSVNLKLAVELMGRSSNLVLVGSDGRIIDCLRRMEYGGDAERRMLPGM